MIRSKYFDAISAYEDAERHSSPHLHFDLNSLAATGINARITRFVLDHSRFFLGVARTLKPIITFGDFTLVTRYDDVRQVLDAEDVFNVPFGREMRTLSGGADFVLGMQKSPAYDALKQDLAFAFEPMHKPGRIADLVAPLAAQQVASCGDRLDVMRDLVMATGTNVVRGFYGVPVADDVAFSEWSIACSMLLFADPTGDARTRATAQAGAKFLRDAIEAGIRAAHSGTAGSDTVVARLVALQQQGAAHLDDAAIRALLFGMITGFIPTNVLAAGNILSMLMSRRDMLAEAQKAANDDDDARLEAALFEALRFKSPLNPGVLRVAAGASVIAEGQWRQTRIPEGRTLIVATQSAMFDSRKFPRPGAYQPGRPELRDMVFGHGLHWCIGAPIAKAHITQALKPLLKRKSLKTAQTPKYVGPFPVSHVIRFQSRTADGQQHLLTICMPLEDRRLAPVRSSIEALGNPARPDIAARLHATGCIHFMSLNAIDTRGAPAGSGIEAKSEDGGIYIVLEMSADGTPRQILQALVGAIGQDLLAIFASCGATSEASLVELLLANRLDISPVPFRTLGIGYQGTPGMSVQRILKEEALETRVRDHLKDFVDRTASTSNKPVDGVKAPAAPSAMEALNYVRERLRSDKEYWCLRPAPMDFVRPGQATSLIWPILYAVAGFLGFSLAAALPVASLLFWLSRAASTCPTKLACGLTFAGYEAFVFLLVSLSLIAAGALLYRSLRRQEKTDTPADVEATAESVAAILSRENHAAQNHMTAVSHIKAGFVRRLALRIVFAFVWFSVLFVFRRGYLSDIGTIHFARWFSPKGTRKLFFFSNYDGSWESYLEDFITLAHAGLTGVWSNTVDFPKTTNLFFDGATDGDRFKRWARRQQLPTQFWFSAYPKLTTDRIRTNAEVRYGLATARSESHARAWIDLFGSLPRPRVTLETHDIQSIAFGGFGKLQHSVCVLVRFDLANPDKVGSWLRAMAEEVEFGDINPDRDAMVFAISAPGLRKLGSSSGTETASWVGTFPPAFQMGMAHPARARVLGDTPKTWRWGSAQNEIDAVLLIYAATDAELGRLVQRQAARFNDLGLHYEAITLQLIKKRPSLFAPEHATYAAEQARAPTQAVKDGRLRKNTTTYEPFGFADGISQPVIRGTQRYYKGALELHAMSPGEFILGYPDNRGNYPPTPTVRATQDPANILPSPPGALPERWPDFEAGHDPAANLRDLGRNGSYLVIRQLEQDVQGFADALHELARRHPGLGEERIAAKMVGRWQDGSSLTRNPYGKPHKPQDNDFLHGVEDPQGLRCPLGAHIRRAYPRDSFRPGSSDELSIVNRHRLLRVGRPYVEQTANGETRPSGLLFMCLNADIERQFEFVQQTWINAPSIHTLRNDIDPIAATTGEGACFTIPMDTGGVELPNMQAFTVVIGGGYFFVPGRQAMRYLGRLAQP